MHLHDISNICMLMDTCACNGMYKLNCSFFTSSVCMCTNRHSICSIALWSQRLAVYITERESRHPIGLLQNVHDAWSLFTKLGYQLLLSRFQYLSFNALWLKIWENRILRAPRVAHRDSCQIRSLILGDHSVWSLLSRCQNWRALWINY
jgi:hypothetical protein